MKGDESVTGEEIFGMIIMLMVCLGCGLACLGLGIAAERSRRPFGFWTGREVKPESLSDVGAYNRANGRMWKKYSLWYFAAALLQLLNIRDRIFGSAALICVFAACTLGLLWLVLTYRRILKRWEVGGNP